ncbi:MAG: hypothetical protein WCI97_01195 [Bacteroidota bacterium]
MRFAKAFYQFRSRRYIAIAYFILHSSLFTLHSLSAQTIYEFRSKKITKPQTANLIDSFSVVPGSVSLTNLCNSSEIPSNDFIINYTNNTIQLLSKIKCDTMLLKYRVYPFNFSKPVFHKDFITYNKRDSLMNAPFYIPEKATDDIFNLGSVDYDGNFSRGISFGNNQDLVVNSALNLQMSGRLAGDVNLNAAITDNNIPIQPEGNTAQLQEFDKVFIQLSKKQSSLTVGDFDWKRPESYFLNYYKKQQGAAIQSSYKVSDKWKGKTLFSAAAAKGKYTRNQFDGQEGNQGPYKLIGANGETFIIILAGTEKVFVDGALLQRGEGADYIIDYNSGEVTFMPRKLITQNSRINVEFEYSDKNYFRSTLSGTQQFENDKWKFTFNFYSESDAKNQPLQQTLDSTQKKILFNAGDSLQNAYFENVDSIAWNADRVLYKKVDSIGFGIIYVYSINPDIAHFSLQFSYVGEHNGHYVVASSTANGRVYKWVAPVAGVLQGNYEPLVPIIAPQKTQMFTLGINRKISKSGFVNWEGATSNKDLNLFSSLNDKNNQGYASKISVANDFKLKKQEKNVPLLNVNASYEYAGQTFVPVERYRPVEFDRDWNLTSNDSVTVEQFATAGTGIKLPKNGSVFYNLSFFQRTNFYSGIRHQLNGNLNFKGWNFISQSSFLQSRSNISATEFIRPQLTLSYSFKHLKGITPGIKWQREFNTIKNAANDSLSVLSFHWDEYTAFLKTPDTTRLHFALTASERDDYKPVQNIFQYATTAYTGSVSGEYNSKKQMRIALELTYRELHVTDSSITAQKPDQSMLGRSEWSFVVSKGFITSQTVYGVGSVQEQKQEFSYVLVPAGQGVYSYAGDFNNNGVKDLNEFEIAPFTDLAEYIKVFSPTNDYIKAFNTQLSLSLSVNPKVLLNKKGAVGKFVSRFNTQSSMQINRKILRSDFSNQFNPFDLNVADTSLVSITSSQNHYLYFNRSNPFYGMDLGYQNNQSKSLLVNGFESRETMEYYFRLRWNISKKFTTLQKISQSEKSNRSEFFDDRNYVIPSLSYEPQLIFQPGKRWRIASTYFYSQSENTYNDANEKAIQHKVSVEGKYNLLSKSNLTAKVTYANISFNALADSPAGYVILQGLQVGSNWLWNLTWDKKLSDKLNLSLSYDGRKTGTSKIVHVGRVQLQALF